MTTRRHPDLGKMYWSQYIRKTSTTQWPATLPSATLPQHFLFPRCRAAKRAQHPSRRRVNLKKYYNTTRSAVRATIASRSLHLFSTNKMWKPSTNGKILCRPRPSRTCGMIGTNILLSRLTLPLVEFVGRVMHAVSHKLRNVENHESIFSKIHFYMLPLLSTRKSKAAAINNITNEQIGRWAAFALNACIALYSWIKKDTHTQKDVHLCAPPGSPSALAGDT